VIINRLGFESYLKNLPDGRNRVAVARALAEVAREDQAAAREQGTYSFLPAAEPSGWWQWLLGFLTQPVPALVAAAGLILSVGLLAWWFNRYQQLNHANQELLAQLRQGRSEQEKLQQDVRDRDQRFAAEQDQIKQLEQKLQQQEKQLRETQTSAGGRFTPATTVFWVLSSGGLRNLNDPLARPGEVRLSKNAKNVELKFPIREKTRYAGYRVLLQTFDGRQTLWMEDLPAQPPRQEGQYVILRRPASQFANAAYKLTLTLREAGGDETTRDYYFTVVKQ
jgi:hypothetical protein